MHFLVQHTVVIVFFIVIPILFDFHRINNDKKVEINSQPSGKDELFVITAIFNPAGFLSRYSLYKNFFKHMNESGVRLVTIECIFPTLGQTEFQVTNASNPDHIQLRSNSIFWMKENLINIAVSRLPPHAKWICWLDADINFHDPNWVQLTIDALKNFTVVQMFETAEFLGPRDEVLKTDYSFGYSIIHGKPIDKSKHSEWYPHPGYGWAMSRKAFEQIGGLPEFDIIGSGDLHFAYSLLNRVSKAVLELRHVEEYRKTIIDNSDRVYKSLVEITKDEEKLGIAGYVPVRISHYWHGSIRNRQYGNRWNILVDHNYNPQTNLRKREDTGQIELVNTSLQNAMLAHFQNRLEDTSHFSIGDNVKIKPISKSNNFCNTLWVFCVGILS